MKPLFTVHAGEYLVGTYIESNLKNYNLWVPTKDTGIDLLVTNKKNNKAISLQVKFSRDFLSTHMAEPFQRGLRACGWWTIKKDKIKQSTADLWVFVLYPFQGKRAEFIVMSPSELLKRQTVIHGRVNLIQSYLWVTEKNKCWEARGLKKNDQILVANHAFQDPKRDFSLFLNNWDPIKKKLR